MLLKKLALLACAALASASFCYAETLTPEQALARLNSSSARKLPRAAQQGRDLQHQATVGNLYIFSAGKGYAVLPDDDRAPALLAFSDDDAFVAEGNPGLEYWLEFYNNELNYLRASKADTPASTKQRRAARAEIAPLLTTEWNQEGPYNMLCPKVDGHETVTGCVATAMAQVMKFHNYPAHGKGKHSYYWAPGKDTLSFNYDSIPFQWDLMTDRYDAASTEAQKKAVAELMLGCGISVDMHYEPGGSGAATTQMGEALIDIFGYSPALWMPNRAFYGYNEWEGMIYDDLAQGLPVLYSGAGTAGGHQFVCDGYRADGYFHFNWGWGGLSNGYFLLTALNPDNLGVGGGAGGFNSSQVASLGVRPATGDEKPVYIMYNTTSFEPTVKEVKAGEDFRCTGEYFNYSLATMPDGSHLGMKFVSASDKSDVRFMEGPGVGGLHLNDGRIDIQVRFPELADGTYYITPSLHVDGKWSEVRMPVGYPAVVTAVVKDGVATLSAEEQATVSVADIEVPSVIYRNREFPMPFNVHNTGTLEFYADVTPYLLDSTGTAVAQSKFRPLDVFGGKTEHIGDYIADFTEIKGKTFPAGDYTLVFRDRAGKDISTPVAVKVEVMTEETSIKVSDFKLETPTPVTDPTDVLFSFAVDCESGIFFDELRIDVFPGAGGYEVAHQSTERIYLTPGEHREMEVAAKLDDLKDGEYQAYVYRGGETMSDAVYFRIERAKVTGLDYVCSGDNVPARIYSLDGIQRTEPLAPGLYIINGQRTLIR